MKKREEFAVSLRKMKNKEIISAKRRKLLDGKQDDKVINSALHQSLVSNETEFNQKLKAICPQAIDDKALTLVSDKVLTNNYHYRVREFKCYSTNFSMLAWTPHNN